mmetsp:Transcript_15107/g.27347  ORF Transcript_15107/g.27347 Transcript_15107/m.27347 type:complete len:204 (-) Transcript_15107:814-1425(-)
MYILFCIRYLIYISPGLSLPLLIKRTIKRSIKQKLPRTKLPQRLRPTRLFLRNRSIKIPLQHKLPLLPRTKCNLLQCRHIHKHFNNTPKRPKHKRRIANIRPAHPFGIMTLQYRQRVLGRRERRGIRQLEPLVSNDDAHFFSSRFATRTGDGAFEMVYEMTHVVPFVGGVFFSGGEVEDGAALFVVASTVDFSGFIFVCDYVG